MNTQKELKIQIPEGYEIDKEKSTFEKIVFKKKESIVNCWEDIKSINGVFIDIDSKFIRCTQRLSYLSNNNIFLNEKYAKSALALAQISQLLPYYDSNINWGDFKYKYCIDKEIDKITINQWTNIDHVLAFNSKEEAERFLKYNEQLVKDYLMID